MCLNYNIRNNPVFVCIAVGLIVISCLIGIIYFYPVNKVNDQQLWLVGQVHAVLKDNDGIVWSVEGIYESETQAKSACKDDLYFIGPITINENMNQKEWPAYFPLLKLDNKISSNSELHIVQKPSK